MFFDKFFSKLPTVKAQEEEEELQDPQQILRVCNINLLVYICYNWYITGSM